ncbi:MAG: polyprenyl synthetase family protein [Methanobacteriota archaeon]|nr:MAG: polyprenyl synthetase family protein [Euryarchaeota archaeon]
MKSQIDGELVEMVEEEIRELLEGRARQRMLYDMMRYHLGWLDEELRPVEQYKGKRFRPLLCLLTYNALSGVYDKAVPAAAAIELIHNFSLIHDDIEDRDEERRHKPTVWKLWGDAHAINVGDGMHVLANLAALRLKDVNVTEAKVVEVLQILNETVMTLCEGQYLDMSFEERLDVTTKEYLEMIRCKTAALIESSVHVGAVLATEDEKTIKNLRRFGRDIGMAFQIRDDIIGTWGDPKSTGKPRGSDIGNRKKTLPVIYVFERSSAKERKELASLYSGNKRLTKREIAFVIKKMEEKGAYEYAVDTAAAYEKNALKALRKVKLMGEAEEKITSLVDFLINRDY